MLKISQIILSCGTKQSAERLLCPALTHCKLSKRTHFHLGIRTSPKQKTIYESPTKAEHLDAAEKKRIVPIPENFREVYPEFLPDPKVEYRNAVREKIERMDMLNRRSQVDFPEFYVGSIVAVTSSDPHSTGKVTRFAGICVDRDRCGLRTRFILRNVIDHQGIEVAYEMYDPTIQKIEVLRLEKRPDEQLFFLRDALPEYSTFDPNMEPEKLPEGESVPVNMIQVKLKPRPWLERWERSKFHGIDPESIKELCPQRLIERAKLHVKPWEKYDLMKEYRKTIPEEEQKSIYSEILPTLQKLQSKRGRKRAVPRSKK